MFQSKFLLNRQKIFNPWEIHLCLKDYLPTSANETGKDFFYRLEWYKIGVVVPLIMYSKACPETKILEECQIFETKEIDVIAANKGTKLEFSLFAHPKLSHEWDAQDDEEEILEWFTNKAKKAGKVSNLKTGPNNTVYYENNDIKNSFHTVSISGLLEVNSVKELTKLVSQPIGLGAEFGCGLLLLK